MPIWIYLNNAQRSSNGSEKSFQFSGRYGKEQPLQERNERQTICFQTGRPQIPEFQWGWVHHSEPTPLIQSPAGGKTEKWEGTPPQNRTPHQGKLEFEDFVGELKKGVESKKHRNFWANQRGDYLKGNPGTKTKRVEELERGVEKKELNQWIGPRTRIPQQQRENPTIAATTNPKQSRTGSTKTAKPLNAISILRPETGIRRFENDGLWKRDPP